MSEEKKVENEVEISMRPGEWMVSSTFLTGLVHNF